MSFHPPEPMFYGYDIHDHHHHFQGFMEPLMSRSLSYSVRERCEEVNVTAGDGDTSDDDKVSQLGEKKRRLNPEQVKALEKGFELGKKLEPERKRQLARALGVQPRQVAIWFQNRRVRWKTKRLEKDYYVLKTQVDSIKADNNALKNHNNKLHAQLMVLKGDQESNSIRATVNLNKETEGPWSNVSDNSCEDNTTIFYTQISNNLPTSSSVVGGLTPPYLLGQQTSVAGDEGFCNMFNGIEDQPALIWPWPEAHEQQHQPLP